MIFKNCIVFISIILTSVIPIRAVLNYHDEEFFGNTADRYDWRKHPCNRECIEGEKPLLCKYVFVVEQLSSMSKACYDCPFNVSDCFRPHCMPTDGVQKTIVTANRQIPGPTIEVCVNDVIAVEVRNLMMSESTTIHWHGIKQIGTPYMDGVPFVTQCPILPGERFQYIFHANNSGTYFWHSHIGSQRGDGLFGPLIIRLPPNKNPYRNLYDYDNQHMSLLDWENIEGLDAMVWEYQDKPIYVPNTILVNGLGRYKKFTKDNESTYVPSTVFEVQSRKRYRFRVINAGAGDCPMLMSIDNHTMLVISLDSSDIEPVEVDTITTWAGERVDFVLAANQIPGNYWIRYRGYGQCQDLNSNATAVESVHQVAILRYSGALPEDPKESIDYFLPRYTNYTRALNPYNSGTETSYQVNISIPLLNSIAPNDPSITDPVDQQVFITFDFYNIDNYDFHRRNLYGFYQVAPDHRIGTLQLNHINLKFPKVPLLSQYYIIPPETICNSSYVFGSPNCMNVQCACTHVINLKLNSVVEIVLIDQGISPFIVNHPMHLHGYFFRVISEVNILDGVMTVDRFKQMDMDGKVVRRLDHAPKKDTIKIPSGGYTIIRVYTHNPGYWYYHCHFEEHNNVGMALIFKVGEHADFAPEPKDFPKCGDYAPLVMK
ncbi:laccase-2-like [Nasonia vitripennis]|uniref:Uncharacterized protein n=1 Tax=Nasonia vitripennis TaxID=7425 RepID=A0A7M7IX60_NASVI|nr:laccase-2-like [Nasonia vitripennis]